MSDNIPTRAAAAPRADAAAPVAGAVEGRLLVALAGNPNSGKSTIFNHMTGARQHVANYPGVTVEKKSGVCRRAGVRLDVVDLPGTYSLTAYSEDELVARDFVIEEHPDVVVCIVDASNLERHLYLAVQFMELGLPLVIALNMSDIAKARGYVIDAECLSGLLGGVPLVPTVGNRGEGVDALLDAVVDVGTGRRPQRRVPITCGPEIDDAVARLAALLEPHAAALAPRRPGWVALKLLEGDSRVRVRVQRACPDAAAILAAVDAARRRLRDLLGDDPEILIADRRYGFISGACQESVRNTVELRHTRSDQIDAIVTHPILGLPLFLGLMYLVFYATFGLGEWPMLAIDYGVQALAEAVGGLWAPGSESPLKSLIVDGVIGGVGGVIVFLPNILILFLAIGVLEASGYMARAAFIVDRWMHKIGLHGKSFIPMIIGFGCTVPALMATRILESRRERLTTMLILPLMSCGARLPIYVLLTGALFPAEWRAPVMWILYLVGVVAAVALAKLLRATLFRGEAEPFVMELPPYRAPTAKGLGLHVWQRGWMYVRKAGTLILGVSVLLWALTSYPKPQAERLVDVPEEARPAARMEYSAAGRIGRAMEPVTMLLGFDWRVNTALVGAFAAKEVFVAQMGIVYSMGSAQDGRRRPLPEILAEHYTPLQAAAIMLFCLLGFPCMATVAVMWSESGSWKWALLQWGGLTVFAYLVTLIVYQAGLALGLGTG
jgi:ferrous iron transport protein B